MDTRTSLILCCVMAYISGIWLYLFSFEHKRSFSLRLAAISFFFAGTGYLLLALRGTINDMLSVVAGNFLVVLSLYLYVKGVGLFRDIKARPEFVFIPLIAAAVILHYYYAYVHASVHYRVLVSDFCVAFSLLLAAKVSGSKNGEYLETFKYLKYILYTFSFAIALNFIFHAFVSKSDGLMGDGVYFVVFFMVVGTITIVTCFTFLQAVNQDEEQKIADIIKELDSRR